MLLLHRTGLYQIYRLKCDAWEEREKIRGHGAFLIEHIFSHIPSVLLKFLLPSDIIKCYKSRLLKHGCDSCYDNDWEHGTNSALGPLSHLVPPPPWHRGWVTVGLEVSRHSCLHGRGRWHASPGVLMRCHPGLPQKRSAWAQSPLSPRQWDFNVRREYDRGRCGFQWINHVL